MLHMTNMTVVPRAITYVVAYASQRQGVLIILTVELPILEDTLRSYNQAQAKLDIW